MTNLGKTYPAESYTRAECLAMLDVMGDSATGKRNRALTVLMWRSGLRLAEALALRPIDIDPFDRSIRVLHGKGDKARTVAIDAHGLEIVNEWLDVREAGPRDPIVCTLRAGKPLEQSYVREMYPRIAARADVDKRVHAHGFRHTFAVDLARARVSMINIQRLLGHSSLQTTSIYLASLAPEEALDAVRGREW